MSSLDTADLAVAIGDMYRDFPEAQRGVDVAGLDERIYKWLDRVRKTALKFDAKDFTISLQIPFGLSASFTWPAEGPTH